MRDAERRGDMHLVAIQHHRCGDCSPHPFDDGNDVIERDVAEQHSELVAAESCRGVGRACDPPQAVGDLDEQVVADQVAQRIVDQLELVQVEEDDGVGPVRLPMRGGDRVAQPLEEQPPVREPGHFVVERAEAQLLLEPLLGLDVGERSDDAVCRAIDGPYRQRTTQDPPVAAVAVVHSLLHVERVEAARRDSAQDAFELLAVVGVQTLEPVLEWGEARWRGHAEQFVAAIGEVGELTGDVPIPETVVRRPCRQAVALFAGCDLVVHRVLGEGTGKQRRPLAVLFAPRAGRAVDVADQSEHPPVASARSNRNDEGDFAEGVIGGVDQRTRGNCSIGMSTAVGGSRTWSRS